MLFIYILVLLLLVSLGLSISLFFCKKSSMKNLSVVDKPDPFSEAVKNFILKYYSDYIKQIYNLSKIIPDNFKVVRCEFDSPAWKVCSKLQNCHKQFVITYNNSPLLFCVNIKNRIYNYVSKKVEYDNSVMVLNNAKSELTKATKELSGNIPPADKVFTKIPE